MNNFKNIFNSKYKSFKDAFGNEPLQLVKQSLDYVKSGKVLDLGVGNGRNTIFFLKNGFKVTGVDFSEEGLKILKEKVKKYSKQLDLKVGDVRNIKLSCCYEIIVGTGLLHFLEKQDINTLINRVQSLTSVGGLNIFITRMVQNPRGNLPHIFKPNELKQYYEKPEWEILSYNENGKRAEIMAKKVK